MIASKVAQFHYSARQARRYLIGQQQTLFQHVFQEKDVIGHVALNTAAIWVMAGSGDE
jgi:hypothetical protein